MNLIHLLLFLRYQVLVLLFQVIISFLDFLS
nr:MAG TPA: hypothetical protein [Caudoviricetes sp.]DAX38641.1 MAG TPA: hypothetical protein [Caudoviricetes sp.]